MASADLKAAFNMGLGNSGSCISATMGYVPENRKLQRLTFVVVAGGSQHTVTEDVPPGVDLVKKSRELAITFAEGLGD